MVLLFACVFVREIPLGGEHMRCVRFVGFREVLCHVSSTAMVVHVFVSIYCISTDDAKKEENLVAYMCVMLCSKFKSTKHR